MQRKKPCAENYYDLLGTKYGATPGEIWTAVQQVGPDKARLETYFMMRQFLKNKMKQPLAGARRMRIH